MPQRRSRFIHDTCDIPLSQLNHDVMITKPFIQTIMAEMGKKGIAKFCTDVAAVNMQLEVAGHLGPVERGEFLIIDGLPLYHDSWFLFNNHRRVWSADFMVTGERGLGTNDKIYGQIIPSIGMVGLMSIKEEELDF